MKLSENAGLSWSSRIIAAFSIRVMFDRDGGGRRRHADRLAGKASLAKEIAGPEHRDHAFLPCSETTVSWISPFSI